MKSIAAAILLILSTSLPAWANCSNPSAPRGEIVFNSDHNVFQGCVTGGWQSLGGFVGPPGTPTIPNDNGPCTPEKSGTIRFDSVSSPPWQYCDGTNWVNFKQPQCADDATGECYLAAARSDSDPNFSAANIADGVNILGVTGTLAGGVCPNSTQVFEAPGLSELYVPAGCTKATIEAWGAGGGVGYCGAAGTQYMPGSGGGGSVVVRDSSNSPLVAGGGGGGGGTHYVCNSTNYALGGGGGYAKTSNNITVTPGEKLRVYVGGGGFSQCALAGGAQQTADTYRWGAGGAFEGGAAIEEADGGDSVYGGGGVPLARTIAGQRGGDSVYGGGGGSTIPSSTGSVPGGSSTYGGAGGAGYRNGGVSPTAAGQGGSGLGATVTSGSAGTVGAVTGANPGGAGATGGGLMAGSGAGVTVVSSLRYCDPWGGDGRVRISWSN